MNDFYKSVELRRPEGFDFHWQAFLQNPLWYVVVVTCLAGVTVYLRFWWQLTVAVALLWGMWLVWHTFSNKDEPLVTDDEVQLQNWLNQALDDRAKIKQALNHANNNLHPLYEPALLPQLDSWVEVIAALVQRLALLRRDELINREIAIVPQLIKALELQLMETPDETIRAQLEQALTHRRRQLAGLKQLQTAIKQAEIQIENTLSLLSTLYTQILTGQSITQVTASHRFLTDVEEEVNRLEDRLEALCQVKGWS